MLNSTGARDRAMTIVTAALESKSIELLGPNESDERNNRRAEIDAKYLNYLINSLTNNILEEQKK